MYPFRSRHPALFAALDQAFFFAVILLFGYAAILFCGFRWLGFGRYGLFVLLVLPAIVASVLFAAQLSRVAPPPVEPRNRLVLREIRPERRTRPDHRHAA
jgi:hypothetical protein